MGIKKVYNSKQGRWFRRLLGITKGEELAKRRREKRAKEEETRSEEQPNRLLMPRASVEEMQKYEGENS